MPPLQPTTSVIAVYFALMYFIQTLVDPSAGIMAQPLRVALKEWQLSAAEIGLFMGAIGLPWALKPLLGIVSDFVPLFGSRRRNYLLLVAAASCVGCLVLTIVPVQGSLPLLFLLVLPALGVAFGDVLIDALMVTEGQRRKRTGLFQSVQWTAAYAGLLLTGVLGGWISEAGMLVWAFGIAAFLWAVALSATLAAVRQETAVTQEGATLGVALRQVWSSASFKPVALILFLWNFNPLWTSVIYLHLTETRGMSEIGFGHFLAAFSVGAMIGSAAYPLYCRRVALNRLVHLSIVAGIVGNSLYLALAHTVDASFVIAVMAGCAYMTGTMVHLDVAARNAPLVAAATVFAVLMALTNLASSTSEGIGAWLYDSAGGIASESAYIFVCLFAAVLPASCWLVVPVLRKNLPEWFAVS